MEETYQLAKNYELGINGVEKNVLQAFLIHRYLSELNYALSQYWLGKAYLNNLFCPIINEIISEKDLLPNLIEQLNYAYNIDDIAEAKAALDKIKKCNLYHAKRLLHASANQGISDALFALGELYIVNDHGCQDIKKAKNFLKLAAEQNHAEAICVLGELSYLGGNYSKSIALYQKAAGLGCVRAIFNLANCYEDAIGVEKDNQLALEMIVVAANNDHSPAQYHLSMKYLEGYTIAKNDQLSVFWCLKAAEGGYAGAQNSIGTRYAQGVGVKKNYTAAIKWYRKAIVFDWPDAYFNLAQMFENGYGVQADDKKAIKIYKKASDKGHIKASRYLSFKYQIIADSIHNDKFTKKKSKPKETVKLEQEHNQYLINFYKNQSIHFHEKSLLQKKEHLDLLAKIHRPKVTLI